MTFQTLEDLKDRNEEELERNKKSVHLKRNSVPNHDMIIVTSTEKRLNEQSKTKKRAKSPPPHFATLRQWHDRVNIVATMSFLCQQNMSWMPNYKVDLSSPFRIVREGSRSSATKIQPLPPIQICLFTASARCLRPSR